MHATHISYIVIIIAAVLTGCGGEEQAREYAAQLAAILQAYQNKVESHIKAQTEAYDAIARELDTAARQDVLGNLDTERNERIMTLRENLSSSDERSKFTRIQLKQALNDYAQSEFSQNREMVTQELDAYRRFLTGMQDLQHESAEIAQLQKQFVDLSKKSGALDQMKRAAAFGKEVKDKYDRMLCEGSKAEAKELQANIDALDKRLAAAAVNEKPALQAARQRAQDALNTVKDRIRSLGSCQ